MMIRIAVADDHELIREGLKRVLMSTSDLVVAGEAATLAMALTLLARVEIDVLVLDLSLGGASELDGLRAVRDAFPTIPVLVLSLHPEERFAVPVLKMGAAGYVCKAMAAEQVVVAIRRISRRGRYVSPRAAELLADELSNPVPVRPHAQLSGREQEVLCLLGNGLPVKRIAAQLNLSISSVNTYRARIFRKMGLQSTAALIRYAVENGLVA